ncbi:hypothetical protein Csa_003657, partial [Cucumis sativus]
TMEKLYSAGSSRHCLNAAGRRMAAGGGGGAAVPLAHGEIRRHKLKRKRESCLRLASETTNKKKSNPTSE